MEENIKEKKLTFWNKMKIAIFKLENYAIFVEEKLSTSFKYLFLIILLSALIISVASLYDFTKIMSKVTNYIRNEIPEFTLEDGILEFEDYIEGYDEEYNSRIIINTFNVSDEDLLEYTNKVKQTNYGIVLLKDKVSIYINGDEYRTAKYTEMNEELGLNITNKSDLISILNTTKNTLLIVAFFTNIVTVYIVDLMRILLDVCMIAAVGWVLARICGMKMKVAASIQLAIYSLTLSIILATIYSVVTLLTDAFTIQYFELIYIAIAYIYYIAAIFMIRDDLIKEKEELEKIYEVQKEVREELQEEKENVVEPEKEEDPVEDTVEPDKKEEPEVEVDSEEKGNNEPDNREPDGSEI